MKQYICNPLTIVVVLWNHIVSAWVRGGRWGPRSCGGFYDAVLISAGSTLCTVYPDPMARIYMEATYPLLILRSRASPPPISTALLPTSSHYARIPT
jgi:hypothetical protein